jgi:GT2 family glycosyltransferase
MSLSIIIVSWNTRELTLKCLESIFNFLSNKIDFEVFVVDNHSTDGTVEHVTQTFRSAKNLRIIENRENLGFAKANNLALKQARGEFILLLNPDTELIDDSLLKLIDFLQTDATIGLAGPKLLNSDLTLQKSCRQFPTLLDQIFIQLKFYNLWPEKIKIIRDYFMLDFLHDQIRAVDQIMGAAMLIKREVMVKVGFLDEKFWALFEEVDFCKRAKDVGYQTYFYPDAKIIHHKEQSFRQLPSLKKQINFNRSLYHYFKKHKPWWQFFLLWLLQPLNLFLTWLDSVAGIRKNLGKGKDL